jgi:hypothetical protein
MMDLEPEAGENVSLHAAGLYPGLQDKKGDIQRSGVPFSVFLHLDHRAIIAVI